MRCPASRRPRWKSRLIDAASAHCRSSRIRSRGWLLRQRLQHAGDLVEEEGLRGRRRPVVQRLLHPRHPGRAIGQGPRPLQERRAGEQGIDQRRAHLQHRLQRGGSDRPQAPGVLAAQGARGAPRLAHPR